MKVFKLLYFGALSIYLTASASEPVFGAFRGIYWFDLGVSNDDGSPSRPPLGVPSNNYPIAYVRNGEATANLYIDVTPPDANGPCLIRGWGPIVFPEQEVGVVNGGEACMFTVNSGIYTFPNWVQAIKPMQVVWEWRSVQEGSQWQTLGTSVNDTFLVLDYPQTPSRYRAFQHRVQVLRRHG